MDLKTAKDMPAGTQVSYRGELWTVGGEGDSRRWNATAFDHNIDAWLANGGQIVFVPSGRGRWLAEQERQEARERLARHLYATYGLGGWAWDGIDENSRDHFRTEADEILAVITGKDGQPS